MFIYFDLPLNGDVGQFLSSPGFESDHIDYFLQNLLFSFGCFLFRFLVINTKFCYSFNIFKLTESKDIDNLISLVNELKLHI
jgi:hypothetical protein